MEHGRLQALESIGQAPVPGKAVGHPRVLLATVRGLKPVQEKRAGPRGQPRMIRGLIEDRSWSCWGTCFLSLPTDEEVSGSWPPAFAPFAVLQQPLTWR